MRKQVREGVLRMTKNGENLKRAAELEAMAEVAASQAEKDALLKVAQDLLDRSDNTPDPSQANTPEASR
jgi:hypothetical protein